MIALIIALTGGKTFSQKVGVLTPNPQAPLHIASSGQVNTAGGLVVLGDTSEGCQTAPRSLPDAKRDETGLGTRRGARQSMAANWRILSANFGLRTLDAAP